MRFLILKWSSVACCFVCFCLCFMCVCLSACVQPLLDPMGFPQPLMMDNNGMAMDPNFQMGTINF